MYCGSCLRDNALAAAMMRAPGDHRIVLAPLYTPLNTDEPDVSTGEVFYGGVNVYLQQASRFFRYTPRVLDWILDRRRLLKFAGRFTGSTPVAELGDLTVNILKGRRGRQRKELRRLVNHLARKQRPDAVVLPNAMFLGMAATIRKRVNAAVVCQLTGEDVFLDALAEPHKTEAQRLIRAATDHVDRFVATSRYYAQRMAAYLEIDPDRIDVVGPVVTGVDLAATDPTRTDRPPTIAYMARICPEKGLDRLVKALIDLRKRPGMGEARLIVAGHLPRSGPDKEWFDHLAARAADALLPEAFEYVGEVDRAGKRDLLNGADVLCVPATRPEPKGMYVLEGWAAGLPFVGFDHGAFGELLDDAGAGGLRPGLLTEPGDAAALADGLAELLGNRKQREQMGRIGRQAVLTDMSAERMAERMLDIVGRAIQDC